MSRITAALIVLHLCTGIISATNIIYFYREHKRAMRQLKKAKIDFDLMLFNNTSWIATPEWNEKAQCWTYMHPCPEGAEEVTQ